MTNKFNMVSAAALEIMKASTEPSSEPKGSIYAGAFSLASSSGRNGPAHGRPTSETRQGH